MENIIFCGGCGTFISASEISAGKASKINNIYYCQKCSTGTQPAPSRPAPTTQARPVQARPSRPGGTAQPAPVARPATPASRPQAPIQAQKPPASRPTVPAAQLNDTVPINQPVRPPAGPAKAPVKPAQLNQPQKLSPSRPPSRPSQTSRLKPAPVQESPEDMNEEGLEGSPRRFGKAKSAKGGIKKIYLIAGAAVVVLIVVIAIIISMSNAAKQKAEDERQRTLKGYFSEIEEAEREYPAEPQKVIDQIKKREDALKGTDYEKKVAEKEQAAKARIEIADKIKELEVPVDTLEQVEQRLKDISALKSNPAVNDSLGSKLREISNLLTKQKKKLVGEEKKALEEQEAAEKKTYDDFKTKITALKNQKAWKEMLRECDILLGRPNTLQYQEEVDKIKAEAKEALEEQQEKIKKRKEWQVLNDDISKWDRAGDSKSEIYVDDDKIMLKNPNSSANRGAITTITNNNEKDGWKDFTLTLEFKVLSGSLDMSVRGGLQVLNYEGFQYQIFTGTPIKFPRKFKDDWQKYTIELKGKKLTISGSGLSEPAISDVPEGSGEIGINIKGGDNIIVKELKVKVIE